MKCEINNVTGHCNVQGLDPYDEGNLDNLQQMSAAITNDACIQNKNDSCVETPCSSASSVYHHVNNNAASSIFSSKLLPSKNFSFGIYWKSAPSVHHYYHGKVDNLNNCANGVVNCKTQPYRKRIRIIYSSDEVEEENG